MIDDQDMCEWENVSSGTASPGQSRTKGRKTLVLVAVVVVVVNGVMASCMAALSSIRVTRIESHRRQLCLSLSLEQDS